MNNSFDNIQIEESFPVEFWEDLREEGEIDPEDLDGFLEISIESQSIELDFEEFEW
jgi:hypothetical protein